MASESLPGYITKKEVEQLYGRSHRSLTRDFSSAMKAGDTAVLNHLKLRLEDGTVIEGGETSLDRIQELSNQGMSPTWFVERSWAELHYTRRGEPVPEAKATDDPSSVNRQEIPQDASRDAPIVSALH